MKNVFNIFIAVIIAGSLFANDKAPVENDSIVVNSNDVVQVYPNPAQNFFYVSTTNNAKVRRVIVFNIVGHKILDYVPKNSFRNKEQVNVSRLPSGKYFLKILLDDNTQEMKHLIKI